MHKKKIMFLSLFDGGGQGGDGGAGSSGGTGDGGGASGSGSGGNSGGGFTYEQLDEIASSRASAAEKTAISRFLQKKGLTEEEADAAFADWKTQKAKNSPDNAQLMEERDAARKELELLKNTNYLRDKGVRADELEFVQFKIEKLVDDKTDFKKAADKFLKENPKYTGRGYRVVSTGKPDGGSGTGQTVNDLINTSIRSAFGR